MTMPTRYRTRLDRERPDREQMDMETARKILAGIIQSDPETRQEAYRLYYESGPDVPGSYANLNQAQRPSIPAGPSPSNFTPRFESSPTGYDQFGRPTSYNPDFYATRETAEELARLLGGRVAYNPGVTEGPFTIPGSYEIEINGRRYNAGQLARMFETEQLTYNQAVRDYELNRQLNPGLFTNGPGFHTIIDPATAVLNRLQATIDQERRWEEAARARDAATPTGPSYSPGPSTPATPATPTQPAQRPTVTRTWYEFYRRDRPLDQSQARQVEDSTASALAGLNNQVINEQAMGVPLGSPGARIARVTYTGPDTGNDQQASMGTGPGQYARGTAMDTGAGTWPSPGPQQGDAMSSWSTTSAPGTEPWFWPRGGPGEFSTGPMLGHTTGISSPYWNNSDSRAFTGSWGPMGPGPRPVRNQPGWLMPLTSGPSAGRPISNYSTRYNPGASLTF